MLWTKFNTYDEGYSQAFEALCDQLFENSIKRDSSRKLAYFTVTRGSGGDGGIESYAQFIDGTIIGLQAKWYPDPLNDSRLNSIERSIRTARKVRNNITKYVVCIPRNLSPKRVVRGGKITENSEEDKWINLITKIKMSYPDLEIELWNEIRIIRELQYPESEGIYRFWFTKEELSFKVFRNAFEKAKSSWLNQKYVPALHNKGTIGKIGEELLFSRSYRADLLKEYNKFIDCIDKAVYEIDFCLPLITDEILLKSLEDLKICLSDQRKNVCSIIECVKHGSLYINYKRTDEIHFPEVELIEKGSPKTQFSITVSDLKKIFDSLENAQIKYKTDTLYVDLLRRIKIILGNPGTGKTHGAANLVESLIEMNIPGILIQAKSIQFPSDWRTILITALGLSSDWSEASIWQSFESCSHRCDIRRASAEKEQDVFDEPTRFLICIDGVDETSTWDCWVERFEELKYVVQTYPRLRFIICSRPYVFKDKKLTDELFDSISCLPDEGDSPVSELFNSYMMYYNINIKDVPWIKWSIISPLALRLFCDIYRDCTIKSGDNVSLTISNLLRKRIDKLEDEIIRFSGNRWGISDFVILRSMNAIVEFFVNKSQISRKEICNCIIHAQERDLLDDGMAGKIIDKLTDLGFLICYTLNNPDPLAPPETYYTIAYQSLMDYFIAKRSVEEVLKNKLLPPGLAINHGAQQMAAIILLADHALLVGDDDIWNNDLPQEEIEDLRLWALSNIFSQELEKYIPWVERLFKKSMPSCRKILNNLIIKVARIQNHPLGPRVVHDILLRYNKVAERDLIWSGPEYLPRNHGAVWEGWGENRISDYSLEKEDTHEGLPLIFSWSLTSVDNELRYNCRRELTKWGILNLKEFVYLIEKVFVTNDPQMKEDLICIAYGVASLVKGEANCDFISLVNWIIAEIFNGENIKRYSNVIIRYAARAIVERAYMLDLISSEMIAKARPPYPIGTDFIEQDANAARSKEDYFGPIEWDLSWYVIKESYEGFFEWIDWTTEDDYSEHADWKEIPTAFIERAFNGEYGVLLPETEKILRDIQIKRSKSSSTQLNLLDILNFVSDEDKSHLDCRDITSKDEYQFTINDNSLPNRSYPEDAEAFLQSHAEHLGLSSLTPHQFALSASFSYLKRMGWNKPEFYGKPNGGKKGEILGIDIAIIRKYPMARHGERSTVMSFAEKYVWCSVHEIMGYLSDRLFYYDHGYNPEIVKDYSLIVDVPNPAQEIYEEDFDKIRAETGWFLPGKLAPSVEGLNTIGLDTIKLWIYSAPIPNLIEWINPNEADIKSIYNHLDGKWCCLYNFVSETEPKTYCDSILWINSFIISKENFKILLHDLTLENESLINKLSKAYDAYSSIRCRFYISPYDVCWMDWKEELHNRYINITIDNGELKNYYFDKAVTQIYYNSTKYGEQSYLLPSQFIRSALKIKEGTGHKFYNMDGKLMSFSSISGIPWRNTQHMLYVKRDELESELENTNSMIFWIARLYREPSIKLKDIFGHIKYQRDAYLLLWKENDGIRSFKLNDEICLGELSLEIPYLRIKLGNFK